MALGVLRVAASSNMSFNTDALRRPALRASASRRRSTSRWAMERTSLLTVTDQFQLSGIGLVVMPNFSVPAGWTNIEETVLVQTSNGALELSAQFQQTHFKILDVTAPVDRRWRIVLCFPTATKEQVPVGSVVYVSHKTKNAILKNH